MPLSVLKLLSSPKKLLWLLGAGLSGYLVISYRRIEVQEEGVRLTIPSMTPTVEVGERWSGNKKFNIPTHSDAADLAKLVNRFRQTSRSSISYQEQRKERSELILEIAEKWGFDKAMSLIDDEVGNGLERTFLIAKVFEASNESITDSLKRLSTMKGQDVEFAIAGLYNRIDHYHLGDQEIIMLLSSNELASNLDQFGVAFSVDLLNARSSEESLAKIKRVMDLLINVGEPQRSRITDTLLRSSAASQPFAVWDIACGIFKQADHTQPEIRQLEETRRRIAEQMLYADPGKALSAFAQQGDDGLIFLSSGIKRWMKLNEKDASRWIELNKSGVPASQLDELYAGVTSYQLERGDLTVAHTSFELIKNPALKKTVEGQLWTVERDSLRKDIAKEPAGTLEAIISGQSKYADYWLEEAMGTWVAKDFDKAQDWYNQNWKSLPASKSQYVAAAFANQALTQGDAATASQWAALIQDPKTKQRIQDGINKAIAKNQNQ